VTILTLGYYDTSNTNVTSNTARARARLHLPKNPSERLCVETLVRDGWEVTRRGWPDFAAFRGDDFLVAEVKRHSRNTLKRSQLDMMQTLARFGVKCYKFTPDGGFERVIVGNEVVTGGLLG